MCLECRSLPKMPHVVIDVTNKLSYGRHPIGKNIAVSGSFHDGQYQYLMEGASPA